MYFYHRLYLSPSITNPGQAISDLRRQKGDLLLYVLLLSEGSASEGGNQIEFCHSAVLQQPYYRQFPPIILGLAKSRSECLDLVKKIVEETYEKTGGYNIRAYLFPDGISAGIGTGGKPCRFS